MDTNFLNKLKMSFLQNNNLSDSDDISNHDIYIFNDYDEFLHYFYSYLNHDVVIEDENIFYLSILEIKDDGTIIASSNICKEIISSLNNNRPYVKELNKKINRVNKNKTP